LGLLILLYFCLILIAFVLVRSGRFWRETGAAVAIVQIARCAYAYHILVLAVLMLFSALLSAKVDLIVIPSPSFGVDCFGLWRRHWPSNRRSIELTSRSGEKYNGSWLGWVSRENLRAI
jgi:hypothetical protein